LQPHSTSARGGTDDQPRSEKTVQPSASDSAPKFVAAIRRALKQQEDRLTELADRVFHYEEAFRQARDQLPSQKTRVEEAQATYENAKLIREVAENKVREFRDGQFVGDLAQAEAEIKNAQEEITISREGTKQAENRLAKIRQASRGTVMDLSLEFESEGKVAMAQLEERKARLTLEQAESKKKVLVEYTKGKRLRELQAGVEKVRSEELARRIAWEHEMAKAKRLEAETKEQDPPPDVKQILVLLGQAASLHDQIRDKMAQVTREGKLAGTLETEIKELTSRLRAIVEEADGERAAIQFDKLKPRIRRAASPRSKLVRGGIDDPPRSDPTSGPAPATSQSDFLAETHRTLKTQHDRMIELADQVIGAGVDSQRIGDQLVDQQIRSRSAEAAYENAKLTREVAEIGVIEYREGIFIQDEQAAEYEVRLAQSGGESHKILIDGLRDQLARIQQVSQGSATDLTIEFQYRHRIIETERRERKTQLEVEKAKSKLKMLVNYTKLIRLNELQAEVATARSEELAKRAVFEIEAAKQQRLAAAAGAEDNGARSGRVLALLDNAMSVEERLRAKFNQVKKDATRGLLLQNKIQSLMGQLEAIVEEAEAERSAFQFDQRKARIRRATRQPGVPAK